MCLQVVGTNQPQITAGSGRKELADWLASKDNPLTARVMVNRVWLHLFGRGLVPTPDNFGAVGQPPTHPELLDNLAVEFMDDGWSVKRLIRRLVLTHAYRLGSRFDPENYEADPDNALVWRTAPRRLDAEVVRDAMLAVSGLLDRTPPKGSDVARAGDGPVARLTATPAGGQGRDRSARGHPPFGLPAGGAGQPAGGARRCSTSPSQHRRRRAAEHDRAGPGAVPAEQPVRDAGRRRRRRATAEGDRRATATGCGRRTCGSTPGPRRRRS